MLKDFIAKQPINVIIKTEITSNRVVLPVKVDPDAFHNKFQNEIESVNLTPEKAIYLASINGKKEYVDSTALLNSKLKF